MLSHKLINAGFSEKEALVYLAILELGQGNIAQIVKKSGVKRATVYLEIESLKKKGYVSLVNRKKKKVYISENPRCIEERLEEKKKNISKLMPELLSIANAIEIKPKVRYFEGVDGVKEVYKDSLNFPGQEILGYYSDDRVDYFDKSFVLDYYMNRRIKNKSYMRMFAIDSKFMRFMHQKDTEHLRKMKLIKSSQFPFSAEINLYGGDRIAIISHRENFGLIIESKQMFITLKSIFEIMWSVID